jgi:tetratricopeptide (TPR) repeat protein
MDQGTRSAITVATLTAAVTVFNAMAMSQTSQEWRQCSGGEGPILDVVIGGCSAVIQRGQETSTRLAIAFNNRGVAYRLKGEYDRALTDYDEAIRLNPNSANAHNNRGIIYRIKGDYDRAIGDYDEAILLENDFPAAFYNRAIAYSDKGDYDRALTDFDIVLQFNANNALALYARGMAKLKKGDTEVGTADIAAAKAINPKVAEEYEHSGRR